MNLSRITAPAATPAAWLARDAAHLIHPVHDELRAADAPVWSRGLGVTLYDADGRAVLDGLSGLWNVLVGYGQETLVDAASEQMRRLAFAPVYAGSTHERAIELAERLAQLIYPSIDNYFFCLSGSEAIETAIKTARYFWSVRGQTEKQVIITRRGGYHGTTLAALSASDQPRYRQHFAPLADGFAVVEAPRDERDHTAIESLERAIAALDSRRIAAFLAEPIQIAAGVLPPPRGYWRQVRELCDRHDILLISDEVVCALGRTGGGWSGLGAYAIEPDLVALGKGLTSGYAPLAAVGFSPDIAAAIRRGTGDAQWMRAGTHSAHPVAAAVALANLELLADDYLDRAQRLTASLHSNLASLADHPQVAAVRQVGLAAAVELVASDDGAGQGVRLQKLALAEGLFSRARGDMFHLAPAYATSEQELGEMIARLRVGLDRL